MELCSGNVSDSTYGIVMGLVCILAVILNILNIVTWRKLHQTPVAVCLTFLSVADLLVDIFYLCFIIYFYIFTDLIEDERLSKVGVLFIIVCFHGYIFSTTLSSAMVLAVAVLRYLKICHPRIAESACTIRRAKLAIFLGTISVLGVSGLYFPYYVIKLCQSNSSYKLDSSYKIEPNRVINEDALMFIYGIILRLIPCLSMIYMSVRMVRVLHALGKGVKQTSWMLIIIMVFYICTGLPSGIISLQITIKHVMIQDNKPLHYFIFLNDNTESEVVNVLQIIDSFINFFVYFFTNDDFIHYVKSIFKCSRRSRYEPIGLHFSSRR